MTLPAYINLEAFPHSALDLPLTYVDDDGTPIDTTGYTAVLHVVTDPDTTDLSAAVTFGGVSGAVDVLLSVAQVDALPRHAYWYLWIDPPGTSPKILFAYGLISRAR